MSGQYSLDGAKPNSNSIPRVVFMATAQKWMPRAPQTVSRLTFALDVGQEKTRLNKDSKAVHQVKLSAVTQF